MNFLFVSDFEEEANSGAAGTLIAIGKSLKVLGHDIDYLWQTKQPYKASQTSLQILFELPKRQYVQVAEHLRRKKYDVVIISQPFAYLVYEKLIQEYPKTLFLNRTHGWEDRVNEAHHLHQWDGAPKQIPLRVWKRLRTHILRRFCMRTAKACHGLIAPSQRCSKFIREAYGVDAQKISTIAYGLDESYLGLDLPKKETSSEVKMLYVGNYIPMKGSSVMEAMLPKLGQEHPQAHMTFVVPEGDTLRVREFYKGAFGDRLQVRSWMNRDELRKVYATHDVLLFPSLFEGFGKTLLEAMAFGLCVVGYDEGAISDLTHSGEAALYCKVGDKQRLRELISQCLSNAEMPRKIGWLAHQLVQSHTWERNARETEKFCHQLQGNLTTAVN